MKKPPLNKEDHEKAKNEAWVKFKNNPNLTIKAIAKELGLSEQVVSRQISKKLNFRKVGSDE